MLSGNLGDALDWAVASRPCNGQTLSGDHFLAAPFNGGLLLGVIDGLGHGEDAARASEAAVAAIGRSQAQSLTDAIAACHDAIRRTRGVVLSLVLIEPARDWLAWAGVGNVEAVLFHDLPAARPRHERIVPRAGVVGYRLPALREQALPIAPLDVLVLATDGVSVRFGENAPGESEPHLIAQAILDQYGREDDDALVLVARYHGGGRG